MIPTQVSTDALRAVLKEAGVPLFSSVHFHLEAYSLLDIVQPWGWILFNVSRITTTASRRAMLGVRYASPLLLLEPCMTRRRGHKI